jgi:hypothetical protein
MNETRTSSLPIFQPYHIRAEELRTLIWIGFLREAQLAAKNSLLLPNVTAYCPVELPDDAVQLLQD